MWIRNILPPGAAQGRCLEISQSMNPKPETPTTQKPKTKSPLTLNLKA